MKAAILAVGDELLAPGRVETNAIFLTEKLAGLGIPVVFRGVIGDDEEALARAMRERVEEAGLLFVTGGLGPTSDDRTRDALMRAFGVAGKIDEAVLEGIRQRFTKRGLAMPSVNERQAIVPEGGEVLPNRLGTAPGIWFASGGESAGKIVVLLPGPPRELEPMFEREVRKRLESLAGHEGTLYEVATFLVAGLPESSVEQAIGPIYRTVANPVTTILASAGEVEIRLTASAASRAEAQRLNLSLATPIREALGEAIFSDRGEPLEAVVGRELEERGLTLATAESITGGLIAHRLTEVSGSSRYFGLGVVTYSNESKHELLGVPNELFGRVGAVSEEVARAMAIGARDRGGADLALSVTGIAGPSGGSPEKPVGLVYIGLAFDGGATVERHQLPGDRSYVKRWTSQLALDLVRRHLLRSRE